MNQPVPAPRTTLYLVDASLYVFRAWHSMPADAFRDADGWPTNAVHGFARFLLELLERERPRHIAVAFDEALDACFRNALYPAYKANRDPAPEELRRQFAHCKALCLALGLVVLAHAEYEADDLIGSAARAGRAADQVVGFVLRMREHHQPEREAQGLAVRELAAQFFRRGVAVGLVGGIERIAEARVQRLVERHRDVPRALAFQQFQQEAGEAVHGISRPPVGIAERVGRHRVPGAEHVQAGVDQVERGARGGYGLVHASGRQSVSSVRASGRSRSGTSCSGVPMWMNPAIRSWSPSPSARSTGSS